MKIISIFFAFLIQKIIAQDEGLEILSVRVDELLMANAKITSSATCGVEAPETFCRLVDETSASFQSNPENHVQCDICDDRNETKRHPIEFAKSGDDNLWWQSPSMAQGVKYQKVNVTIDLKQVYQIVYILLKMGDSPRPGNWILERSLDGIAYSPWIFFAETPYSCYSLFQREYPELKLTTSPRPSTLEDDDMFCTTFYSQPKNFNSGEIIISLIHDRKSIMNEGYPTVKSVPQKLIDFLSARYIRFRFLKHLTLAADLMTQKGYLERAIYNRYFYSLRNIEIGGKCICNNHADKCDKVVNNGITVARCNCKHNTCGSNCETCCPLFNQKPWKTIAPCEECNCNRKSSKCVYNQTVATLQLSINKMGRMEGGGVCIDCQENTEGINCEKCKKRFYRPWNVLATEQYPCRPCQCYGKGTVGNCVSNGEEIDNQKPGDCICKDGYNGVNCDKCSLGYERYPNGECLPCPCSIEGSVTSSFYRCKPPCNCKVNAESNDNCKTCKNGFFNLDPKHPEGCEACYCFGITNQCSSLSARNLQVQELRNWKLTTIKGEETIDPKFTSLKYLISENQEIDEKFNNPIVYYWLAPQMFLGNWLTSYGSVFSYIVKIELYSKVKGSLIDSADVIIKCGQFRLFYSLNNEESRLQRGVFLHLKQTNWKIGQLSPQKDATRDEFISCLVGVDALMIKAKYYSNQKSIALLNVTLSRGDTSHAMNQMLHIEKCDCPPGYSGLSCESCITGYRRVNNVFYQGQCEPCRCYNHSSTCDPYSTECTNCLHNTAGKHCDECKSGYFGNPKLQQPDSCKKCACPLLDYQMTDKCSTYGPNMYICHECMNNTSGVHCDKCNEGYFGNPMTKISCKKCNCNNNQESCSPTTGECKCSFTTMGSECQFCKHGFYGNAIQETCKKCDCDLTGSKSQICDRKSGQCVCKSNFVNRNCSSCAPGFFLKNDECIPCNCNKLGRIMSDNFCDSNTGQCYCLSGIKDNNCSQCLPGYYNFPNCRKCQCSSHALTFECDPRDGTCKCGSNVKGPYCNMCQEKYFWINETDCSACNCKLGSLAEQCDMQTGSCRCARNVALRDCSKCELGYFNLSPEGCKECPKCFNGKVCNNDGICVCPPNTIGDFCDKCDYESWGYNSSFGCKKCNCLSIGSNSMNCDKKSGKCQCRPEYEGLTCNQCAENYYGFPYCKPCECSVNGTITEKLQKCDPISGQCECKQNSMGKKCDLCKIGTFPSTGKYKGGCYSCFCFGVSEQCLPLLNHRMIKNMDYNYHIFNQIDSYEIGKENNVILLNSSSPPVFGWPLKMFRPVYVDVLKLYDNHDMSLFYNSVLLEVMVNCSVYMCGREDSVQTEAILESYNGLFEIRYLVNHSRQSKESFLIELSDHSFHGKWIISKYKNDVLDKFIFLDDPKMMSINLTRDIFMMALLNVTSFKVKLYSDKINPDSLKLKLVTYKVIKSFEEVGKPVTAVEKCICNSLTTGNHCQNPIDGYYKRIAVLPDLEIKLEFRTGNRIKANFKKCDCNGYSKRCASNTGICLDCSDNTIGNNCELCANGYYGDPKKKVKCKPCPCPTEDYNFAKNCTKISTTNFKCSCEKGYTGLRCEKCEAGFFGNPHLGNTCKACECNPEGSLSKECDSFGVCRCAEGVLGDKCDKCSSNYVVENQKCQNCYYGCTKELLVRIDKIDNSMKKFQKETYLSNFNAKMNEFNVTIQTSSVHLSTLNKLFNIKDDINNLLNQVRQKKFSFQRKLNNAKIIKEKYDESLKQFLSIFKDIRDTTTGDKQKGSYNQLIDNATEILKNIENLMKKMPRIVDAKSLLSNVSESGKDLEEMIIQIRKLTQPNILNDLIILRNKTMLANEINKDNEVYINTLKNKNSDYNLTIITLNIEIDNLQKIANVSEANKNHAENQIKELDIIAKKYQDDLDKIHKNIIEIKKLRKNITDSVGLPKEYIIPESMKREVKKILEKNSFVIKNLTEDLQGRSAKQAKEAYSNITRDVLAVEKAINETEQLLNNNRLSLNFKNLTEMFIDSTNKLNTLDFWIQNKNYTLKNLKEKYDNLKERQKRLQEDNKNLRIRIPVGLNGIESLKGRLDTIQAKQVDIEKNVIAAINKTLSSFNLSKPETKTSDKNLDSYIMNVSSQYNDMIKDSKFIEDRMAKLRENIRSLKERLQKARINSELAHGAAARSAEPIRHVENCVRHYVTYYLAKSNAFSLEFYMKLKFLNEQSLVLFGYDDSGSTPHTFAFTTEQYNKYKFMYDNNKKIETIEITKRSNTENYLGVYIIWKLGKWEMFMKSVNDINDVGNSITVNSDSVFNNIRLGPQTNVFIGGFPSLKLLEKLKLDGKLISELQDNYGNKFFKGCLFGVKLMNSEFGLQDIVAVEEDCRKSVSIDALLQQPFNCKVNRNISTLFNNVNIENINKFKLSVQRKKRDANIDFDIYFSGNGYAMVNTSRIREGNCKLRLNKVLSIATSFSTVMSMDTYQIVAVFANYQKDIGFVLALKNSNYFFGYWNKYYEKPLNVLNDVSQNFRWNIFRSNINNLKENIFGIEEICDSNSFFYLGNIPYYEQKLRERLNRLNIPVLGFIGKMKLEVNQKNEFQILATRFINVIFLPSERFFDSKCHSLYISPNVKDSIEINPNLYNDILQNGFAFTIDFLGTPLNNTLTLLTIEMDRGKCKLDVSKDLTFSLYINDNKLEKTIQKLDINSLDWGGHYVAVQFSIAGSIIMTSISIDYSDIKSEEFEKSFDSVKFVMLGSSSNFRNTYYIYNLFLGQKLIDFNTLNLLPPGVYLKSRPSQLQPVNIQYIKEESLNPFPTVSNIISVAYSASEALNSISKPHLLYLKHNVTKNDLNYSKPKDYPSNSAWFDGISNSFSKIAGTTINQFRQSSKNEISLMLRSISLRPEQLMSFDFGQNAYFHIFTINGHIVLFDSQTKLVSGLSLPINNGEWRILRIIFNNDRSEKNLRIIQDNNSFDLIFVSYNFARLLTVEIGRTSGSNQKVTYKNREYNVEYFTGCIDDVQINNRSISILNGANGNSICPRFMELLSFGGQILDQYVNVYDADSLIKLKTGNYSPNSFENTYVTKLAFRYSGIEEGTLLIAGDGKKFCSLTVIRQEIHLQYYNVKSNDYKSEFQILSKEKWYKLEFVVFYDVSAINSCTMMLDGHQNTILINQEEMFVIQSNALDIYFGSHPDILNYKYSATKTSKNFVGCVSNLEFSVNEFVVPCRFEKSSYIVGGRCSLDKEKSIVKKLKTY